MSLYRNILCLLLVSLVLISQTSAAFALDTERFQLTSAAEFAEVDKLKGHVTSSKPKLGLALGGGGGRGSAHIGVLKILDKAGLKFDYICGTSIGSVIGGLYAHGSKPDNMEKYFSAGMRRFMTVPLWFRLGVAPVMFMPRMVGFHPYDGLYRGNKFRKYVVGNMKDEEQLIENFSVPFGAVVLNLIDGKPYIIRKGNFGYAIQASCAVPSLRKPVELDEQLFCDGGVICNLPVKQCREMGAELVIAVNINEPFYKEPLKNFRKAGSVSKRMLKWALYENDAPQEAMADILIHPYTEGISLMSSKKSDAKLGVAAGEDAAREKLPEIKKLLSKYGIEIKNVPEPAEEDDKKKAGKSKAEKDKEIDNNKETASDESKDNEKANEEEKE